MPLEIELIGKQVQNIIGITYKPLVIEKLRVTNNESLKNTTIPHKYHNHHHGSKKLCDGKG